MVYVSGVSGLLSVVFMLCLLSAVRETMEEILLMAVVGVLRGVAFLVDCITKIPWYILDNPHARRKLSRRIKASNTDTIWTMVQLRHDTYCVAQLQLFQSLKIWAKTGGGGNQEHLLVLITKHVKHSLCLWCLWEKMSHENIVFTSKFQLIFSVALQWKPAFLNRT